MTNPVPLNASLAERLAALRALMGARALDAVLVPRGDEHLGEYVPPSAERLAWLTGFTGSAGLAVILKDSAALFVDGRYTLQAAQQAPTQLYEIHSLTTEPYAAWLRALLGKNRRVGYDPWLHSAAAIQSLKTELAAGGIEAVALSANPIDAIWADRPAPPTAPIVPHPLAYAGVDSAEKRDRIGRELAASGVGATVLTQPDSIAWLLNIRGGDVPNAPLPLSFAILMADGHVALFVDERKLSPETRAHLGNAVTTAAPDLFGPTLDRLAKMEKAVRFDPQNTPAWVADRLNAAGAKLSPGLDPCQLPKAIKNEAEIEGAREAHRRDGAALVKFFTWLDHAMETAPPTEITAAERLAEFRAQQELFMGPSFDTISGAAEHGAVVHYRAMPDSDKQLAPGMMYLLDSGGQYLDATTDVTRTMALGEPTRDMCHHFTLVLKGHIALGKARFPSGTSGGQLDALARAPLWDAGVDYDHGTGHGVGSYLSVHEGPQRIFKNGAAPLEPGMIVSNEPGYYRTGEYGIRIENLVLVKTAEIPEAERQMLEFETLTLAPIDRDLIDVAMLTAPERAWINDYHARVYATLAERLNETEREWLAEAVAAL
ncbi:MAG: X-Pro aminopeptidase [Rhodospirillales bacterium]|nr:X-Pro aminopeptidase [Rhodospirillales bacterium]